MRPWVVVVFLSFASGCAGCDTGVDPVVIDAATVDVLSARCMEAQNHSDLDWLQENVFTPSCSAFRVCHQGEATSAGGLNLEPGNTQMELFNQPSQLAPDWDLVVPGSPEDSYLLVMLGQIEGPIPSDSGTMPENQPLLCKEKREAVARWIEGSSPPVDAGVDAMSADAGVDAGD